jgi:hypothetical protein
MDEVERLRVTVNWEKYPARTESVILDNTPLPQLSQVSADMLQRYLVWLRNQGWKLDSTEYSSGRPERYFFTRRASDTRPRRMLVGRR